MTYSKTHKRFVSRPSRARALEHPEEFLGVNYKDVLNFWWFLDGLSEDQWKIVWERYQALGYEVRGAAWKAAYDATAAYDAAAAYDADAAYAAYAAAWDAAYDADAWDASAWDAAYDADAWDASAWDAAAAGGEVAGYATLELIGSRNLLSQGKSLVFLPLFLDL
jgi:hypothetical protein